MSTLATTRRRSTLPADLQPEQVVAVVDSREQLPLDLAPLSMVEGTLTTGDYSVVGLTDHVTIERKSLSDLLACCGGERDRFERELQRLLAYPTRAVVCECSWSDLQTGEWRSKLTPASVMGSVCGWIAQGVPFVLAGNRAAAADVVRRILYIAARRRWREARALAGSILEGNAE